MRRILSRLVRLRLALLTRPEIVIEGRIRTDAWEDDGPFGDYWLYYPKRLEFHAYDWDGRYYSALPVTYSAISKKYTKTPNRGHHRENSG